MAKLELKLDDIHQYGFPHACLLCSSDEDPQLEKTDFNVNSPLAIFGCSLLFGPIGWIVGIGYALYKYSTKRKGTAVPVCSSCSRARKLLRIRDIALIILGFFLFVYSLIQVESFAPSAYLWKFPLWLGLGAVLYGLIEFLALGRQFRWRVIKSQHDRVLLELPNDDYPSLYQRHLDTAVLYGAVESLGTPEEAQPKF